MRFTLILPPEIENLLKGQASFTGALHAALTAAPLIELPAAIIHNQNIDASKEMCENEPLSSFTTAEC